MVCFILQSPPHIDREPVSFITLGSCPPFQSQHTTDLLLFVDGEQIGPGRVVVVVGGEPAASSGSHPTSDGQGGVPF